MSFGDAAQVFHIGPASCGVYGTPAGVCEAVRRWGSVPLEQLAAPAAELAREGVLLNAGQAYIAKILADLLTSTPECAALWAPQGHVLREGELLRNPELGDALVRLGEEGAEPFYRGDIAAAVCDWLRGARRRAVRREPGGLPRDRARAGERALSRPRGAHQPAALGRWDAAGLRAGAARSRPAPPRLSGVVEAMAAAQSERTPEFVEGLSEEGFLERFLATRLGSTTHISVLDADGRACSVTCSNGEGSGVVVPGTGMHLNNVMGEEDLNPLGFHRHPAGTADAEHDGAHGGDCATGEVELVLGSAGSNRIRSALLQTIVGVVDHGLGAREAVDAPRVHFEDGMLYAEPGIEPRASCPRPGTRAGGGVSATLNLFFGGVQAVLRRGRRDRGRGRPAPRRRGGAGMSGSIRARASSRRSGCSRSVALLAGCGGGIVAPDLFIVQRTGSGAGGAVDAAGQRRRGCALHTNSPRGPTLKLSDPQLVRARAIQEELHEQASEPPVAAARRGVGAQLLPARRKRDGPLQRQLPPPAQGVSRTGAARAAGGPAGLPPAAAGGIVIATVLQPKRTLPLERARACARSTSSRRLIAARKSSASRRRRAFSERSSSSSCLASGPNSTVAAIR